MLCDIPNSRQSGEIFKPSTDYNTQLAPLKTSALPSISTYPDLTVHLHNSSCEARHSNRTEAETMSGLVYFYISRELVVISISNKVTRQKTRLTRPWLLRVAANAWSDNAITRGPVTSDQWSVAPPVCLSGRWKEGRPINLCH
ncbi:hypothetical protein RRG08_055341 [Elysia crispata]|uniref:Uncharacterized protein n=1 Tax=Elysia crispata TaxID=231223 RepID=A0AAE1E2J6_9GAST|nr:hypothetical protein RRG08_055341 [Elysia crispata]